MAGGADTAAPDGTLPLAGVHDAGEGLAAAGAEEGDVALHRGTRSSGPSRAPHRSHHERTGWTWPQRGQRTYQPSALRSAQWMGAVRVMPHFGSLTQNAWVGGSGTTLMLLAYSS